MGRIMRRASGLRASAAQKHLRLRRGYALENAPEQAEEREAKRYKLEFVQAGRREVALAGCLYSLSYLAAIVSLLTLIVSMLLLSDRLLVVAIVLGAVTGLLFLLRAGAPNGSRYTDEPSVKQQFENVALKRYGRKLKHFYYDRKGKSAIALDSEAAELMVWTDDTDDLRVYDHTELLGVEVESIKKDEFLGGSHVKHIDLKIYLRDNEYPYVGVCFHAPLMATLASEDRAKMEEARTWEARIKNMMRTEGSQSTGERPSPEQGQRRLFE